LLNAARLYLATIVRRQESKYQYAAHFGFSAEFNKYMASVPLEPGRRTLAGESYSNTKLFKFPTFWPIPTTL
jgi:hypothetical protein